VIEAEAPVRAAPFRFKPGALLMAERQRGTIVDGRFAPAELDLALEIEFLRRLVGRIGPPRRPQPLQRRVVDAEALRLAMLLVCKEAEPGEVLADGGRRFFRGASLIGVVEPQDEAAAILLRPQPIVNGGADVADVEAAGRRGSEAGDDVHGRALGRAPRAGNLSRRARC
jgi:hypothetical protein